MVKTVAGNGGGVNVGGDWGHGLRRLLRMTNGGRRPAKFPATASAVSARPPPVITALKPLSPAWRRVCMTLAVLALVIKVAVPAGYMVETTADGAPVMVLCTAQGAVMVEGYGAPARPSQATHDAPCAFTGHGAAFVATGPLTVGAVEHVAYARLALAPAIEAVPGRGLAAPPLPARGPPQAA